MRRFETVVSAGPANTDPTTKKGPAAGGFSGAGPCCYLIDRGEALPVPVAPWPPVTVAQRVGWFQAEFSASAASACGEGS